LGAEATLKHTGRKETIERDDEIKTIKKILFQRAPKELIGTRDIENLCLSLFLPF